MNNVIRQIESIIDEAERMKNSYFWSPDQTSGGRRYYEKCHTHPEIEWRDGNDIFTASFTVRCSCRNIYAFGTYTKNGRKTTLTAIRNSLKRLKEVAK